MLLRIIRNSIRLISMHLFIKDNINGYTSYLYINAKSLISITSMEYYIFKQFNNGEVDECKNSNN